jgi:hypothetical protein
VFSEGGHNLSKALVPQQDQLICAHARETGSIQAQDPDESTLGTKSQGSPVRLSYVDIGGKKKCSTVLLQLTACQNFAMCSIAGLARCIAERDSSPCLVKQQVEIDQWDRRTRKGFSVRRVGNVGAIPSTAVADFSQHIYHLY